MILKKNLIVACITLWYITTNFCMEVNLDWQTAFYFCLNEQHIIQSHGYMHKGIRTAYNTHVGTSLEAFLGSKNHHAAILKALECAKENNKKAMNTYDWSSGSPGTSIFHVIPPKEDNNCYEVFMRGK